MSRPSRVVLVTGTTTDIGKTWWTAQVAAELRERGVTVAARKPVQSFDPADVERGATDAQVLADATGVEPHIVCPEHRWLGVPMAPPMATDVLGLESFTIADLVDEIVWPPDCVVGFVESAGGPRSPLARDGDTVALECAVRPDLVVLVAHAGLGTINDVTLSSDVLGRPLVVALNRYDDTDELHRRNRAHLELTLDVVVHPVELSLRLAP